MAERYWPRCTSCGSRLPEGAPGTPVVTPIPPPPVGFLRIIGSHIDGCRTRGRQVHAVRINDTDAGRCGITDDIETVLGRPIFRDNTLPLGIARLKLDDGTLHEFALPVYFTEDR